MIFRKTISYLESLIQPDSGNSSKSFGLVLSVLIGGLIGICVCVALMYDVFSDGAVDTNLEGLGWFLLCSGAYMLGGGLNKTIVDAVSKRRSDNLNSQPEADGHSGNVTVIDDGKDAMEDSPVEEVIETVSTKRRRKTKKAENLISEEV